MPLDYLAYKFSDMIFNGCLPSTAHDQLAGELVKARLMKSSGRFDEALGVIDKTLKRLPNDSETLFLKAQILWEGYHNYSAAKTCLQKIINKKKFKNEQEETIHRWAQSLLKDILQEKRARHKRARKDKGQE